jgi:hypothetical protein
MEEGILPGIKVPRKEIVEQYYQSSSAARVAVLHM